MTTLAQVRKAALSHAEVEEGTHFGMVAFSVRGKGFASVTKGGVLQLQLPEAVVRSALGSHPTGERLTRMDKPIGFALPLADINGKVLNALVHAAWLHRAPQQLAVEPAAGAEAGDHELPAGIGKPATTALIAAGITTLEEVAACPDEELLALHGVGPKALRVLRDACERAGPSPHG